MQFKPALIFFAVSSTFSATLIAEPIYKSVDENGKVTYSSTPAINNKTSKRVAITPPPSAQAIEQARTRHQKNLKTTQLLEKNRLNRKKEIAKNEAIKREKNKLAEPYTPPEKAKEQGPYYGIPGHGVIVLPKGPTINR